MIDFFLLVIERYIFKIKYYPLTKMLYFLFKVVLSIYYCTVKPLIVLFPDISDFF
jgi:hypothetical protein